MPRLQVLLALAFAPLLLGTCATPPGAGGIGPFTTDGCSRFPDRAPIGHTDWCDCCLVHDLAYWRGGTAEQRKAADQALRACVAGRSGNAALADLMYAGVRAGGGPNFRTSYRWGYGWPHGRGYQELSALESAAADELEASYRAANPALSCAAR